MPTLSIEHHAEASRGDERRRGQVQLYRGARVEISEVASQLRRRVRIELPDGTVELEVLEIEYERSVVVRRRRDFESSGHHGNGTPRSSLAAAHARRSKASAATSSVRCDASSSTRAMTSRGSSAVSTSCRSRSRPTSGDSPRRSIRPSVKSSKPSPTGRSIGVDRRSVGRRWPSGGRVVISATALPAVDVLMGGG